MEKVILYADGRLVDAVRCRALEEKTGLNDLFRQWMVDYLGAQRRQSRPLQTLRHCTEHKWSGRWLRFKSCASTLTPAVPSQREMR